jgi:hypothetical protein
MMGREAVPEASVVFNQLISASAVVKASDLAILLQLGLAQGSSISGWTVSPERYRKGLHFTKNEREAFGIPRDSITTPGRITFSVIFPISLSQFQPIPCVLSLHSTFIPLFPAAASSIYKQFFYIHL